MRASSRMAGLVGSIMVLAAGGGLAQTLQTDELVQGEPQAPGDGGCLFPADGVLGVDPLMAETVTEPPAALTAVADQAVAYRATIVFEGPCAHMLEAFGFGLGRLSNGEWFQVEGAGFIAGRVGPAPEFLDHLSQAPSGLPNIGAAAPTYLVAARQSPTEAAPWAYIGVWSDGAEWKVAHLVEQSPGQFAPPTVLLVSQSPLRSVSFVPMLQPDNAVLSVVVQGETDMRVHQFRWRG